MVDPTGNSVVAAILTGLSFLIFGASLVSTPKPEIKTDIEITIPNYVPEPKIYLDIERAKEKGKNVPTPVLGGRNNKNKKKDEDDKPKIPRRKDDKDRFNKNRIDIEEHPENWERYDMRTEPSTKKGNRNGGLSTEIIYRNKKTGETITQHILTDSRGVVLDIHYRPYAKMW